MNRPRNIEVPGNNYMIRVEGKFAFHRGDTFSNFDQVNERLKAHTQESLVYYWIRDSRLVKYAHTKVSRKIDEKLLYYSIKFSCIFGGQRFKSKANGLRPCKRQTRQIDCPAFISLRATKCGQKLEVIDVCNDHTHEISEQAVEELPQKRRPSQSLLEEIQELLHLSVDKKLIIDYVKQKENKNILKKDLFNMSTHLRVGMPRLRGIEDQKAILRRVLLTALDDSIQHAVQRRLLQFDSDVPLNQAAYQENLKSTQNSLDVFDTSTSSAIDFTTTLSPDIDLLDSAAGVKHQMEYDDLLSNRIIDYDPEVTPGKKEIEPVAIQTPSKESEWSEPNPAIYKDFICDEATNYVYGELELQKAMPEDVDVHPSCPSSPVSNNSPDLDGKEYFNDLILISPDEPMYPETEMDITLPFDEAPPASKKIPSKRKQLRRFCVNRTRRMILSCSKCGTNPRLVRMQMSYLRQKRQKLFQETELLKLEKQKLLAEIDDIRKNGFL